MDKTETLGMRIQDAVDDYPCWPSEEEGYEPEHVAKLRSLVAYADACERLARAADNVSAAGDSEGASLSVEYHRALAAYREAVARG